MRFPFDLAVSGAVLVDQLRAIDRAARRLRRAGLARHSPSSPEVQAEITALFVTVNWRSSHGS